VFGLSHVICEWFEGSDTNSREFPEDALVKDDGKIRPDAG